jgi:hypothetical protein
MVRGKAVHHGFALGIIIGGTIAFAVGVFAGKRFVVPKQPAQADTHTTPFLTEGFDFNQLRTANNERRGPNIGEKIDLTHLKMKGGKTLASMVDKRPIMLVSINPDCAMVRIASDEMSNLREKLSTIDINYYMAFFAAQTPQSDFFKYSDSLNVGAPSFLWNIKAGVPVESIFTMTTPSHLLLNSDGTVLRVWPGSYNDKPVRQRMMRQIIADTLVATDTLKAVSIQ